MLYIFFVAVGTNSAIWWGLPVKGLNAKVVIRVKL